MSLLCYQNTLKLCDLYVSKILFLRKYISGIFKAISSHEECRSTPALLHASQPMVQLDGQPMSGSLTNLGDTYTRLSVSLEDHGGLFKVKITLFMHLYFHTLIAIIKKIQMQMHNF